MFLMAIQPSMHHDIDIGMDDIGTLFTTANVINTYLLYGSHNKIQIYLRFRISFALARINP